MVTCLILICSFISSIRSIILFCLINIWDFLYFNTSLISFDYINRLEGLLMLYICFWSKDIRPTSMKVTRWSDGATSLSWMIPKERIYLIIFGNVKVKSILCGPRWYVFDMSFKSGIHAIKSTWLFINMSFNTPPLSELKVTLSSIVGMTSCFFSCSLLMNITRSSIFLFSYLIFSSPFSSNISHCW